MIRIPVVLLMFAFLVPDTVRAQAWPSKPIHAVVPVGAGSSTDIVHRLVLEQLATELGQPVVVENRTGAGGTIGTAFVAKAAPDGYTLLANGSAHTIAPALYKSLPYDAGRDFVPVAAVGLSASVLVASPAKGFNTVGALVTAGKQRPGMFNFSSVGVGTATHLSAERFCASAGVQAVHVPYKGGAEAMVEVIAGRVDFFFGPIALVLPQIRDGKLVALAVNTTQRSRTLPDVPTLREAGYANAEYPIWFALFAHAGTPRDIVERLNRATVKVLQSDRLQDRLVALGVEPMTIKVEDLGAFVHQEIALNAALATKADLKPQ